MTHRRPSRPVAGSSAGKADAAEGVGAARRKRFPVQLDCLHPPLADSQPQSAVVPAAGAVAVPDGYGVDSGRVRGHMVQQLRQRHGITDERVLQAMRKVQRHQFVDTALATQAYTETSLPIGFGQTISKPQAVAKMIAALLEVIARPQECRVLEIGTGCGYQCAVLAEIFGQVVSIERIRGLHQLAQSNLAPLGKSNIRLVLGDGLLGDPQAAQTFDGIISAAGGRTPDAWLEQLRTGGRIVTPETGDDGQQYLAVIDRHHTGVKRSVREAVHFVPLRPGVI